MAEKQAGGLSLRIGLTLNQLQSDFLAAEQTVRQGIAALNRQQNIVKLKMETDITGLDSVTDKTKILEIQERSLTQLLEMQRDKLTLATRAYQDYANSKNANATVTKNLEAAMERERLAVARLEAQLKNLSAQKISLDTAQLQENISRLNSKIQHVKIKADIDTSRLQEATAAFDAQKIHIAAVTKELDLQRQKLIQLREAMYQSAKATGSNSVQTLNIKSNVLQQIQEINRLETKLKELSNTDIKVQVRAESLRQIENQIQENISRLNARLENIRVKTEIDTSKLGAAASEFDKAKVHVQNLNRELDLQNQKLAEMRKALATSVSTNGLNSVKTINLQTDIQKQIQEIDQLKAKINELNKIQPPTTNNLLSGYLNIKGDIANQINSITTAFSQLKGATASADSAITSVLGVIGTIPSPVGRAVASLASLPIIFKGIENSIVDMTKAAAASGDSVYVMSRGFQMSVADTAKFSTNAKVAGVEVNDLANTVKFLQRQIARGGEDNRAAEWLRRYGESAFDASGNLKDLNEMTFALSRALKKAQADGKGSEFIFNVFRNISADAITAIEDIEDVAEQASTIVKNGLANPKLAHEVQGNLNAMKVQAGQMNAAFESALLPVANEIIPHMTERMGKFTTLIADNKDLILSFGRDLAEVWGAVENAVDKSAEGFSWLAEKARDNRVVRQTNTKDLVEKYKEDASIKSAKDILEREMATGGYNTEDMIKLQARPDMYQKELKAANKDLKALLDERRKIFAEENKSILENHKYDEGIESATDLLNKLTDAEKEALEEKPSPFFDNLTEKVAALRPELKKLHDEAKAAGNAIKTVSDAVNVGAQALEESEEQREQRKKAQKYYAEAADIRYKSSHSDYENQKFDNYRWLKDQLSKEDVPAAERLAILEQYAARSEQIEQERADKLTEIREKIAAADKTALEQKLDSIEKEKEEWLKAGMEEAEAIELSEKKKLKARQEAAEKAKQYLDNAADIEYGITHTAFEKELRDIERWKEAKIKAGEDASAVIANAAAKEAEAFERAVDRIKGKLQSLDDKIFEIDHSQYENDLRRIQQEYLRTAEDLQKEGLFNAETKAKLDYLYSRQKHNLDVRAAEARTKDSDYTKAPDGARRGVKGGMIIEGVQIFDSRLMALQQREIGLMTNENRIRANLLPKLDASAQAEVEKIASMKALTSAQEDLIKRTNDLVIPPTFQGTPMGSATIIEGDEVTQISPEDAVKVLEEQRRAQQILSQAVSEMPTQEIEQFGGAIQQANTEIEQFSPTQKLEEAQNEFAGALKDFPPEYFKQLADGTKAVSEMQLALTNSTMKLIDAQDKLSSAISQGDSTREISNGQMPNDGLIRLSTSTQRVAKEQELLARTTRETNERLSQRESGIKFGFDYDTFKDIVLTGVGIGAGAATTGVGALSIPALTVGTLTVAGIGGLAKGTYDETIEARELNHSDDKLQPLPATADLSEITKPLGAIDTNVQSILQEVQTPISFETIVTPLNNIQTAVGNILSGLSNRQPPQININPNNNINLGGAYVFDNEMKKQLVDDITSRIVENITRTVQQETRRTSYGYGA